MNNNLGIEFKYLLVNENDKKFGLTINTIGFQTIVPNGIYPATDHPNGYYFDVEKGRVLNEYQFVYITEGSGVLKLESDKSIPISSGQLIVIFPNQWHSYCPNELTGWNEYYIGFCGSVINDLIDNEFLTRNNQVLDIGLNEELVNLYKRSIEIARADHIACQQHLLGIVMHMVGLIISEYKSNNLNDKFSTQIVERAKIIINENVFESIHPEELSERLNINYTSFRKLFKKTTGFPPAKYIQAIKIQKAKQLLTESAYSVKEIAYMLKFYSPESFYLAFKKNTGKNPSKYRVI